MSIYYCHRCALTTGQLDPPEPLPVFSGTQYQLDKFIKHTTPSGMYPVNSVFHDPNYNEYKGYIVSTLVSGSLEIDDHGRKNVVWIAGKEIGVTFENGVLKAPNDSIRVVLHDNEYKIHAFPTTSNLLESKTCCLCGAPIPI